ncbi:MAG: redoxin family protein [Phycisphaerales bacterium]
MPTPKRHLVRAALVSLTAAIGSSICGESRAAPDPFASLLAHEVDPASCSVGELIPDLLLLGFDGQGPTLSEALKDRKAVVLCLTSATCPLSTRYAPRLTAMAAEYGPKGVLFALLNVSDTDTPPEMKQQNKTMRWPGLYLPDTDRAFRRALEPRTTTEVLVIDRSRTLVFRGAVDDQFGVGSALAAPRRNFLREALDAALAGTPVKVKATWSPGCAVDPVEGAAAAEAPGENAITYHNRVSRIIRERCESCHFYGGTAPFALNNYRAVAGRSSMIAAVVRAGLMPPWDGAAHADGTQGSGGWRDDPTLREDEKHDLLAWIDAGRPEGDVKEALAPASFAPGWRIGTPDALMLSEQVPVPADGPLVFARLEIDCRFTEPVWVRAWELMARKRMALHHAVAFLERVKRPEGMGDDTAIRQGVLEPILAAGAAHGANICPPGAARAVPAGARLIVHAWFRPTGAPMSERLRLAVKLAAEPPTHEVVSLPAMVEPPFGDGPERVAQVRAPTVAARSPNDDEAPVRLLSLTPVIALAASAGTVRVEGDDEEAWTALTLRRFRAAWPVRYEFIEPVKLGENDTLRWTGTPSEEPAAGDVKQGVEGGGFLGFAEFLVRRGE